MSKLITTWQELGQIQSENYTLKIEDGSGWVISKETGDWVEYLSTHTFYGSQHKESTKMLRALGFDVEIANWDELGM